MSDRGWWATALQWTLWAVILALVMGWLGRSRFRRRPVTEAGKLAHPPSTLIVGLACFGFFAAIAIISNVVSNRTTTWWTTAVFIGFAALSSPLILDYFMAKHEVSEAGLAYRKLTGTRGYLRWSELRSVRYAPAMKWFRLETRSGAVARVSVMLMGLPEFAHQLLTHAPAESVDPNTLQILQATAKGNPPSVWT
jgi:hypothetical protein